VKEKEVTSFQALSDPQNPGELWRGGKAGNNVVLLGDDGATQLLNGPLSISNFPQNFAASINCAKLRGAVKVVLKRRLDGRLLSIVRYSAPQVSVLDPTQLVFAEADCSAVLAASCGGKLPEVPGKCKSVCYMVSGSALGWRSDADFECAVSPLYRELNSGKLEVVINQSDQVCSLEELPAVLAALPQTPAKGLYNSDLGYLLAFLSPEGYLIQYNNARLPTLAFVPPVNYMADFVDDIALQLLALRALREIEGCGLDLTAGILQVHMGKKKKKKIFDVFINFICFFFFKDD
jgi:hypothetical protein